MFKVFKSTYQCLFYLPKGKIEGLPLIIFLHGVNERGTNIKIVKRNGLPLKISKDSEFPFVVLSPQCPKDEHWEPSKLKKTLDDFLAIFEVDRNRIYLTGLSMGGFGTFAMAIEFPEIFAAIAPICGGGRAEFAQRITNLPTWVFHGQKDEVVPIKRSELIVNELQKLGGNVKFTIYPEGEHDVWTETYDNPELYVWFLAHCKS